MLSQRTCASRVWGLGDQVGHLGGDPQAGVAVGDGGGRGGQVGGDLRVRMERLAHLVEVGQLEHLQRALVGHPPTSPSGASSSRCSSTGSLAT